MDAFETLRTFGSTPESSSAASLDDGIERGTIRTGPDGGAALASGEPKGGQFALGGGRVTGKGSAGKPAHHNAARPAPKKPAGPRHFGYNAKTGVGAGYGVKGGDPDVRILQAAGNRLGVLDMHGKQLAVDGRYGPRTTSVVKAIQRRLGMPVTGQVDEATIKAIASLKSLPAMGAKPTAGAPGRAVKAVKKAPVKAVKKVAVKRAMMMTETDDAMTRLQDLLASLDDEDLDELAALAEAMHNEPEGE